MRFLCVIFVNRTAGTRNVVTFAVLVRLFIYLSQYPLEIRKNCIRIRKLNYARIVGINTGLMWRWIIIVNAVQHNAKISRSVAIGLIALVGLSICCAER